MNFPEIDINNLEKTLGEFGMLGLSFLWKALVFIIIIAAGFKIAKFIEKRLIDRKKPMLINPTVHSFLCSLMRIGMQVLVILFAVRSIGVATSAIVAVVGSAGLAIGLALQGSLSNLASGVLILANKLFSVGDYIEFSLSSGSVVSIGLFYTQLKTPDGKAVYVPNSTITATTLTNYNVYAVRRMDVDFGVAYGADVSKLTEALMELAEANPMILSDPAPEVIMLGFGSYALNMRFRVHAYSENYFDLYNAIYPQIMKKLSSVGIEIPKAKFLSEISEPTR